MTIQDIIAADMANTVFDTTVDETPAETVTYTTVAGVESAGVTVAWSSEDPHRAESVSLGRSDNRLAHVVVPASEIAAPAVGDTVNRTLTGEDWTVFEINRVGAGAANTLTCKRSEPDEFSRDSLRIRM